MIEKRFKCIIADPPWPQKMSGQWKRHRAAENLPYPTMTVEEICSMQVSNLADDSCHLWLWTTNAFLEDGFKVMRAWNFKYLAPIHWIKKSGIGNYFISRTQTILFGYRKKCIFEKSRFLPNIIMTNLTPKHSQKPEESYKYIESISSGPKLELFARIKRNGWYCWGNEIESDIELSA